MTQTGLASVPRQPASRSTTRASVTGWAIHVPGVAAVAGSGPTAPDEIAVSAKDAGQLLGRKGLLFKEPATRLALCAVHRALGLPAGPASRPFPPDPRTAVVAASNLGNVATVAEIVRTLRDEGNRGVSPLAAPNASSNVIASTVARWFGWAGPNLMVCSGATAGLDAVAAATTLLAAGRADRVVVVGTEPDDPTAVALHGLRRRGSLRAAAACVLLERPDDTGARPAIGAVIVASQGVANPLPWPGEAYGAEGVIRLAVTLASRPGVATTVSCGDPVDGWRQVDLFPPTTGRIDLDGR